MCVGTSGERTLETRESHEATKYRDLGADMASQNPRWKLKTVPLVVQYPIPSKRLTNMWRHK